MLKKLLSFCMVTGFIFCMSSQVLALDKKDEPIEFTYSEFEQILMGITEEYDLDAYLKKDYSSRTNMYKSFKNQEEYEKFILDFRKSCEKLQKEELEKRIEADKKTLEEDPYGEWIECVPPKEDEIYMDKSFQNFFKIEVLIIIMFLIL